MGLPLPLIEKFMGTLTVVWPFPGVCDWQKMPFGIQNDRPPYVPLVAVRSGDLDEVTAEARRRLANLSRWE